MTLSTFYNSLITALQLMVAVLLYAWRLPRRSHFWLRLVGFTVVLAFFITLTMGAVMDSLPQGVEPPILVTITMYGLVLVLCALVVFLLYDTSKWSALFCATSGYTLQNLASGIMGQVTRILYSGPRPLLFSPLAMLVVYAGIYALCWVCLVRRVNYGSIAVEQNRGMLVMLFIVIFAVIGFDSCIKSLGVGKPGDPIILTLRAVHALVCCFILYAEFEMMYNTHLKTEMTAAQQLAKDERKQYELSKETIDAINVKVHDIRHQIRHLEDGSSQRKVDPAVLDDIAKEINVYDSNVTTANDALNVILTEKSLYCDSHGIQLSCIADGKAVEFLSPTEIYSLFGNALDNAIEASLQVTDPGKQRISLYVRQQMGMASIHVENYFEGQVEFGANGLPKTTKGDAANHGFGTLSMKRTVEAHGGTLIASTDGDTYLLDIAIPLPA